MLIRMEHHNAMQDAIDAVLGLTRLAKLLGVDRQVVNNWRLRGKPPIAYVLRIEELTGVSRDRLCDEWRSIWPDHQSSSTTSNIS